MNQQVERARLDVSDEQRVRVGVQIAPALLARLGDLVSVDQAPMVADPASVLRLCIAATRTEHPPRSSIRRSEPGRDRQFQATYSTATGRRGTSSRATRLSSMTSESLQVY